MSHTTNECYKIKKNTVECVPWNSSENKIILAPLKYSKLSCKRDLFSKLNTESLTKFSNFPVRQTPKKQNCLVRQTSY